MSTFSEIPASHCVAPTQQIPGQHLIAEKNSLLVFSSLFWLQKLELLLKAKFSVECFSVSQSVFVFKKQWISYKKYAPIIASYDLSNSPWQPQEATLHPHQSLLLIGIPKLRRVRLCQDLFNISVTCDMKHFYRTQVWSPCQVSKKITPLFETFGKLVTTEAEVWLLGEALISPPKLLLSSCFAPVQFDR